MSIGQRIAQLRKEAGLSQETLGEQMGVSRQAIYKWESDAALPEIEKLVALSKLFDVRVGWLLGIEEEATATKEPEELSQAQTDMVTQIVDRYIQQLPQPKKRRWPTIVAIVVALGMCVGFAARLDQIQSQYNSLQNSMGMINYSVDSQINGITNRIEAILKAQNSLTAEYGTRIVSTDYAAGTVTIAMEAVPKTHQPEMSAVFVVDCGNGPQEFTAQLADGRNYCTEVTVPLTDSITVSVVFVQKDGTRQNQLLDSFSSLLSSSYAEMYIDDDALSSAPIVDGDLIINSAYVHARPRKNHENGAQITSYKVGLFRNKKLVAWAEPCEKPANYHGDFTGVQFYKLPKLTIEDVKNSDRFCIAALITDSYGRQYMHHEMEYISYTGSNEKIYLTWPDQIYLDPDPANWILE